MKERPTHLDDVIDSRDIIEAIAELEEGLEQERDLLADHPVAPNTPARQTRLDNIARLEEELAPLKALADAAADYSEDWEYGSTLVRDTYWVDYCRELVAEIGDLPRNLPGYIEIDWVRTADNLKPDYTPIEFDGVQYWVR